MPPVLQEAFLVILESAPLPNAYENTLNPSELLLETSLSKSRSDSPSVRNKINFEHPDELTPRELELSKMS